MWDKLKSLAVSPWLVPLFMVALLGGALIFGGKKATSADGRPVVVYAHPPCPPELMVFYNGIFDDFRRDHPEIDLRVLHVTGTYEDKVKVMFAGDVAPDVIFMYPTTLPAWVSLGALAPLPPDEAAAARRDYFPPMLDAFTIDGKLYGYPKDASAQLLFFNRDRFREMGVAEPTADWTWDDCLAASEKLCADTDGDGRRDRWGLLAPPWYLLAWAWGGDVADAAGRFALDAPATLAGLRFWVDLRTKWDVVPSPAAEADLNGFQLFALGRCAMMTEIYPAVSVLRKQCDFEWDVAPLPKGPAGRVSEVRGSALAVTSACKNKAAAMTFAKYVTQEGMGKLLTLEVPAYLPLARGGAFVNSDAKLPASKQVAVDAMGYARPPLQNPRYNEILDGLLPLDEARRGGMSLPAAVAEARRDIEPVLKATREGE